MLEENVESQIEEFKIEKEDHINCVIRKGPTKLKISSVYTSTSTEPFIDSNTNDQLETDEVVAKTTTSRHSGLIIRTASQINKPIIIVANKNPESQKPNITRVGNTTVKPVRQVISQPIRQQPPISYPPIKLITTPPLKSTSLTRASEDYIKNVHHENRCLRKLLEGVRQESIGKLMETKLLFKTFY